MLPFSTITTRRPSAPVFNERQQRPIRLQHAFGRREDCAVALHQRKRFGLGDRRKHLLVVLSGISDHGRKLIGVNLEPLGAVAAGGSLRPKPVVHVGLTLGWVFGLDHVEPGQRLRVARGMGLEALLEVGRLSDLEDVAVAAPVDVDETHDEAHHRSRLLNDQERRRAAAVGWRDGS